MNGIIKHVLLIRQTA